MKMLRLMGLAGRGSSPVAAGLLAAALSTLAWPLRAFASELDLELPALTTTYSVFGTQVLGSHLLMAGLAVCVFGMLFGLAMYQQVKRLPAHQSMLEVSNIIWETCKTYLFQQGRLLLVLELFIGACIVYYFGVLNHQGAGKVLLILLWSVVGILGSYAVAWFGIRMNTYANSRTAFASLRGKPLPVYEIPLQAGMSIGVLLICVELIMMLVILLFVPRQAAGASFVALGDVYHVQQLDKLIAAALAKRGFSVVEILSPCPTAYGRRNKQANPVDMMNWLKDNVVLKDKLEKMAEDEKADKIASGVLWDVEKPEFTAEYDKLIARLKADKQTKE